MAAPTNAALVKKVLANSEPSTHGPLRPWASAQVSIRQSTMCRLHKQVSQQSRDCAECEEQLRSPRYFRQE